MARRALAACALAALVTPTIAFVATTAQPAAAAGGLSETDTTTYVVDPAAGAVHVTVDLRATNNHAGYYYYAVSLPALAEATNGRASRDGGGSLSVTPESAGVAIAKFFRISFPNLSYGQTLVAHLQYDLPNGAARSTSLTRVTSAFTAFVAWAAGDPGQGSVRIVVPKSFTVDLVGAPMTSADTGGTVTYSVDGLSNPYAWSVAVSARNDAALVTKNLEVAGNRVRVRAFPDDPQWSAFVDGRVEKGVPQLEKLIGLPWPAADRLMITETVTPYLYGYAGWFKPKDNTIEIGDQLDPQVILHEVSHLWFNDQLFDDRWIAEGFAQEYAARAVAAMGGKRVNPTVVNLDDRGAFQLNDWSAVNLQSDVSAAREKFGYNTAWFVIHQIADEIGVARMRAVIAAASTHVLPYAGRTNPHGAEDRSWRAFLDYLDEVGGSQKADALFLRYVGSRNESDFSDRLRTRELYSTMVAVGGEWKPPLVIRERMAAWEFASASPLIDQAESVAQTRDSMERALGPLHLKAPARLQSDYEYRNGDLDAVSREATVDLTAAKALVAASGAVHGHHGFFATIGLIGAKQNTDLANARDSFVAGDGVKSRAAANDAALVVADAAGAGELRLGGAAGLVIVLAVLVWVLRRGRRRRARRVAQAEASLASAEPWVPTPPAVGGTEPWSLPTVPVYVGAGTESLRPTESSPERVGEPAAPLVANADGHGDQPSDDAEPGFGG